MFGIDPGPGVFEEFDPLYFFLTQIKENFHHCNIDF
jgi:hypothetical protein